MASTTLPPPAPGGSPLPGLLLLLSGTTGLVDAVSVLGLGKVFTANMTGNVVFLGFATAGTPGFAFAPGLCALIAFMAGAVLAGRMGSRYGRRPLRHWLAVSALCETAMLWLAGLIALQFEIVSLTPRWSLFAIIALTAIAMGYRNGTIRQLKVPDLTTTVLTLTVTGVAADSRLAGGTNPNLAHRLAAIFSIFGGAAIGAIIVLNAGLAVALFVTGGLVIGGTLLCMRHPAAAFPHPH